MPHTVLIAIAIAGVISMGVIAYSFGLIPALAPFAGNSNNNNTLITPNQNSSQAAQPIPILEIVITYPTEGSTVKGTIEAGVQVSGNVDVEMVEGYFNDTLIDTENSAPYEFTIDTKQFADGTHKFKAIAIGSSSLNATAEVSITVQNLVNILPPGTYPDPVPLGEILPSAEQVFNSETFVVPDEVSNFIILIPNEGHHLDSEPESLIAESNAHYLPTNIEVSNTTTITFLSNDYDHFHSTVVTSEKDSSVVWKTSNIAYAQYTESKSFSNEDAGNYLVVSADPDYKDMKGTITIREAAKSPNGSTVGCIYVPQEDLPKFREIFSLRGFAIESEHNFTWENSNQGTEDQTLIVFSTMHPLSGALQQLAAVVEETPYD